MHWTSCFITVPLLSFELESVLHTIFDVLIWFSAKVKADFIKSLFYMQNIFLLVLFRISDLLLLLYIENEQFSVDLISWMQVYTSSA